LKMPERIGLIAGNGSFPLLVLDAALAQGLDVVVAAIKEEASPEIERHGAAAVYWLSLGSRNTDSLLGAIAQTLAEDGITLENSTSFLEPLLAQAGVLTQRAPTPQEKKNTEYGRTVARQLAQYDIGQTVVLAESACVAVEAMEGTDAAIGRAGEIMRSLAGEASTLGRELTVVKIAKPNQDMRFDVPVIGVKTIEVMRQAGATCLALDAGKCLLLDGNAIIAAADSAGIAIVAD
jgi:DUF1009 family protein